MNWYEESFFNIHVDYHTQADARTGAGLTRAYLRALLGRIQPDMIQVHAKGHPGIASYPTQVGQFSSQHQQDVLAIYRDVTRELGIRFSVYYSSLVDAAAANAHEDWRIRKADGSFYGTGEKWQGDTLHSFFLCHNTGYIGDYLLPQIGEILVRYEPDGLWFDGDVWVPQACYCASCQREFRAQHSRDIPTGPHDPDWSQALRFVRDSYLAYLQRVRDLIREVHPACLFSVNWLHTLRDPWADRGTVDWLSGDVPLTHGVKPASREARFMNHQGAPFDIMICDFSLDYQTRGYMYHKSAEQMKQEAAAVVANGGRLFYWMTPARDAAIRVEDPPTLREVARFVRARQPYSTQTTSVPDLAVLVSTAGWWSNPRLLTETADTKRVIAAHQILIEAGLHHDLVSEEAFMADPGRWPVVLLPGVSHLSQELGDVLINFVQAGGRLLVSGPYPADTNGRPPANLVQLTGVTGWRRLEDETDPLAPNSLRALLSGGWARVYYPAVQAIESKAAPRGQLWSADTAEPLAHQPVSYVHTLGDGQVLSFAGHPFDGYSRVQAPALRELILAEVRFLHPHPVVELEPAGQLEVSVRQRQDEWLIHLVNHGADRDMGIDSYFVERVPGSGPRTIYVRCARRPRMVTFQPGNRPLVWQPVADGVRLFLDNVDIHEVVQLQF